MVHEAFPSLSPTKKKKKKILIRALDEGSGDPAATTAWISAINDADKYMDIIGSAFPSAPFDDIKGTLMAKNGNVAAAYVSLAQRYESLWDEGYSSNIKISPHTNRIGVGLKVSSGDSNFGGGLGLAERPKIGIHR